ncbi:uncharacterized protein LOC113464531 [Ceratina calcarata]|uniref:Uncharacterized protein LOC113464531 n=1 Tax=Ceratina calcarata TaxID=156304 RepID=A0AAJ7S448_9HYME|nr:uncharacterized protein LOC113464531 [Ceratina calcarata]
MSSSSSEKIPKRRFFKHKGIVVSCSTPVRKGVLLPCNTSISEIKTSSSEGIKRQRKQRKEKTKPKGKKELKRKRKISLRKEISKEWETTTETLQKSLIKKSISISKNDAVLGVARSSKNIQQSPQLPESDVIFIDLRSPEEAQRGTNFIEDRAASPILGSARRRSTKRRVSPKRLSFGVEEKTVSAKRQKRSLEIERGSTEKTLQKSSRRESISKSKNDAVFGDARSSKNIQQSPQLPESDDIFIDLRSPEEIRRATLFFHDRLESPIRGLGTRRSETPKRISLREEYIPLPAESLLPRLIDNDEVESPPLVLRRENTVRTYPCTKKSERYTINVRSYDPIADPNLYRWVPSGHNDFLWHEFVRGLSYDEVKKYLRPADDENQATNSEISNSENAKFKTMVEKYGRNMNVNVGTLNMSTGKWKRKYVYITSEDDENFNVAIKKRTRHDGRRENNGRKKLKAIKKRPVITSIQKVNDLNLNVLYKK